MTDPDRPRLLRALDEVWAALRALPDDEAAFLQLSPALRRDAHDLGVRCQDRLVRALARLTVDMAEDGAELVDGRGVVVVQRGEGSP